MIFQLSIKRTFDGRTKSETQNIMAQNIEVRGIKVSVFYSKQDDYISLSDIAKYKDQERSDYILQNGMRNRSTIDFIGLWEQLHNPDFNSIEFDGFKIANKSIEKLKQLK